MRADYPAPHRSRLVNGCSSRPVTPSNVHHEIAHDTTSLVGPERRFRWSPRGRPLSRPRRPFGQRNNRLCLSRGVGAVGREHIAGDASAGRNAVAVLARPLPNGGGVGFVGPGWPAGGALGRLPRPLLTALTVAARSWLGRRPPRSDRQLDPVERRDHGQDVLPGIPRSRW